MYAPVFNPIHMQNSDITDPLFLEAVEAIDSGNITSLKNLLTAHPRLVCDRLDHPTEGYFKLPYLMWFVADNPIRTEKLPPNIVEVTRLLIYCLKQQAPESACDQLNYTLGLVATGRIPKECGVQIEMMDLLMDAGAKPGGGLGAFAHGNIEAGKHLIDRGGKLTLGAAVCLEHMDDITRLLPSVNKGEQLAALAVAGFYGKANMIALLLSKGLDPNGYPDSNTGFHSHATPLHQAVNSGSLDAVKLLVAAGAKLDVRDKIYDGTALDWAEYMQRDESFDTDQRKKFTLIADYLREVN